MSKAAGIKVLMMGARRAGKTSVLAGLVDTIMGSRVAQFIQVNGGDQNTELLRRKTQTLASILRNNVGRTILSDEGSTNTFNDYVLKVSLPGNGGETKIIFTDANGEFFANGCPQTEEIKKKIREYDVIVIAIDTPCLMEAVNPQNTLCTPTLNRMYNQIDNAHTLLTQLDDADGKDAKLVLFVPVKCEYWVKQGMLSQVCNRVEECYRTPIDALVSFKMIEVVILPVQTVGGMVFECHREALILNTPSKKEQKCSAIDDMHVMLSNGTRYTLSNDDNVLQDWTAVIEGFRKRRPNAWFKVVSDKYEPRNCEQLAFFILHYMLCKTMTAMQREERKTESKDVNWWKVAAATAATIFGQFWIAAAIISSGILQEKMGTIDLQALKAVIEKIKTEGLWESSQDSIRVLNKGYL